MGWAGVALAVPAFLVSLAVHAGIMLVGRDPLPALSGLVDWPWVVLTAFLPLGLTYFLGPIRRAVPGPLRTGLAAGGGILLIYVLWFALAGPPATGPLGFVRTQSVLAFTCNYLAILRGVAWPLLSPARAGDPPPEP